MPHLIVEYSSNLETEIKFKPLFKQIHEYLGASGVFPLAGIRSRAYKTDCFLVADGQHDYAFVHFLLKIGSGRDLAVRKKAGDAVFQIITSYLDELANTRLLAISFEMQELDPVLNYKKNNLHAFLAK